MTQLPSIPKPGTEMRRAIDALAMADASTEWLADFLCLSTTEVGHAMRRQIARGRVQKVGQTKAASGQPITVYGLTDSARAALGNVEARAA